MNKIHILPGFYFYAAATIIFVPGSWLISWFAAALIHEIFHIIAVLALGSRIRSIKIGALGAVIESNLEGNYRSAICSLTGPMGGLLLLPFARVMPRVSLCGLFQTVYNLFPILPLDGGRALQSLLAGLFPPTTANHILKFIQIAFIVLLFAAVMYIFVKLHFNMLLAVLILSLFLIIKKIPCKPMRLPVQ